jgi:hypothetical protein
MKTASSRLPPADHANETASLTVVPVDLENVNRES